MTFWDPEEYPFGPPEPSPGALGFFDSPLSVSDNIAGWVDSHIQDTLGGFYDPLLLLSIVAGTTVAQAGIHAARLRAADYRLARFLNSSAHQHGSRHADRMRWIARDFARRVHPSGSGSQGILFPRHVGR